jgi:hypothetical protein
VGGFESEIPIGSQIVTQDNSVFLVELGLRIFF